MKKTTYEPQEPYQNSHLDSLEEAFINFLQQNNMLAKNQINHLTSDGEWNFKSYDDQFMACFTSLKNSFFLVYNQKSNSVETYDNLDSFLVGSVLVDDQIKNDILLKTLTELEKYQKEKITGYEELDHDQRDLDQQILNFFSNLVLKYPRQTIDQMVAGRSTINFDNQQSIKYDSNRSGEEIECNLVDLSDGQEKKYLITKTHDQKILVKEIDQETHQLKDVSIAQKNQITSHLNSLIIPSRELGSSSVIETSGLLDNALSQLLDQTSPLHIQEKSIDPLDCSVDLSFDLKAITENNSTALEIEKLTHFFVDKLLEKGLDITQPMIKDDLSLFIMADESSNQQSKYSINIFSSDGETLTGKKLIYKIYEFSDYYQLDLSRNLEYRPGINSYPYDQDVLPNLPFSSQTFSIDFGNEAQDIDFIKTDFSKKIKIHSEKITQGVYFFESPEFSVSINNGKLSIYDQKLEQTISNPLKEMEAIRKIACDLGITLKNIPDPELLSGQRLPHNQIKPETPMSGTVNLIFSHPTDYIRSLSTNSPTNPTADNLARERKSSSPER
jgi:hypothetical protein